MDVQFPFELVAIVLSGLWQGAKLVVEMFASAPFWVPAVLIAAAISRVYWPHVMLLDRVPRYRQRRQ
jgi:hypothetical protein